MISGSPSYQVAPFNGATRKSSVMDLRIASGFRQHSIRVRLELRVIRLQNSDRCAIWIMDTADIFSIRGDTLKYDCREAGSLADSSQRNASGTTHGCALSGEFERAKLLFRGGGFDAAHEAATNLQQSVFNACSIVSNAPAQTPRYSIIVLSREASDDLVKLLRALARYGDGDDYEIIFVSNGNSALRETAGAALRSFVHVDIPFDFGCSGGRNIGVMTARGHYVLFLDDDGIIQDDTVDELVRIIEHYDAVAVRGRIAPKSGGGIAGNNYDIGDMLIPSTPSAEGVSIWKKKEFLEFGGFDPLLAGHEGFLLCAKMLKFFGPERFLYTPDALLLHDFSGSPDGATQKIEQYSRNDAYLAHFGVDMPGIRRIFHAYRSPGWQLHAFKTAQTLDLPASAEDIPRISILTTARNGAGFIGDYCRMLELQTYRNFEIVFVDDGSSDATAELLEAVWPLDKKSLVLERTEGIGRAAALNLAVARARCDICLIADIDDVSLSNRFADTVSWFQEHPEAGCVSLRLFSDDPRRGPAPPLPVGPVSLKARCLFGMPASFPAFAFRKSAFPLGFDETLEAGVDCDWIHRNFVNGAPDGSFVPILGTYYHLHDEQISTRKRDLQKQIALKSTANFHANYLGSRDEDATACAHILSGWVRMRNPSDLELLRRHESRLIDAIASAEPELTPHVAALLRIRIAELETGMLRQEAKEYRNALEKVRNRDTGKKATPPPGGKYAPVSPGSTVTDVFRQKGKTSTTKKSKEKKPTGVRIRKEIGRWIRKVGKTFSND